MSSDSSQNRVALVETNTITQQLSLALKDRTPILPFSANRLPYGWSPGNREVAFFDLSSYQATEEYCPLDQIITVDCGIKLHALEQFLIANNQFFPANYVNDQTTLLDLILTGNIGPMEIFAGGLRRHVLGLTFALSNGTLAKSGGKVVKNVSGYDLTRFLIGSLGHFALPIKANLRLHSLPEQKNTFLASDDNIEHLFKLARSVLSQQISLMYIDIFDKRLLSKDLLRSASDKKYCLLMQIYGDQITIESETNVVKKLFTVSGIEPALFTENSEQNQLLTALTSIEAGLGSSTQYRHTVEIAIAQGDFLKLIEHKDLISLPFLYRPGSGKLLYCLNSSSEQEKLFVDLNKYVKMTNKLLTASYSDSDYMRRTINIGIDTTDDTNAIRPIKRRLKEQFDPDNLFNPFVDL